MVSAVDVERVVAFLLTEWGKPFRITTVAQAQAALGMPDDVELRLRVGAYLAGHLELNERLNRWGTVTFVLSEDEKLLARHSWQTWQRHGEVPGLAEFPQACGLAPREVGAGLRILVRMGLIEADGRVPADLEARAGGLSFNFHTVTLENGDRFNVPWAIDFLLLVSSDYPDQRVVIEDSCAHCVERIRVSVDRGQIAEVEPPETYVVRGGGWGANNLFRSEGHAQEWLTSHVAELDAAALPGQRQVAAQLTGGSRNILQQFPGLEGLRGAPIREFLERMRAPAGGATRKEV